MPTSDEELERMLRGADPAAVAGVTDRDTEPFRPPVRSRRRKAIPLAVALAAVGATAAGTTWFVGDGEGHSSSSDNIQCLSEDGMVGVLAPFNPLTDDPLRMCAEAWERLDRPVPAELTACVGWKGEGGVINVWPGSGPEVCADHESDPWAGPTAEQLAFARFRLDLERELPPGGCLPRAELEELLTRLLAENGLEGWTIGTRFDEAGPDACMELSYHLEEERHLSLAPAGMG